ncbi:hypothetical protein ABTN03_20290, partial [Acinetobacter baumannii]
TVPMLAVRVAVVDALTADVVTVNVAEVAAAGIVMHEGTVALVELDRRETMTPPVAAGPDSVTVPVEFDPPTTEVGATV